jgi:hypothetical protein
MTKNSFIYSWNLIRIKKGNRGVNQILAGFDITNFIAREKHIIHTQKRMESMTGVLSEEVLGMPNEWLIMGL